VLITDNEWAFKEVNECVNPEMSSISLIFFGPNGTKPPSSEKS